MMKYTNATNPQWFNAEHTSIYLLVDFEDLGVLPFSATMSDCEAHGREIFERAIAGEFGEVAPFVEPAVPAEVAVINVRLKRDALISVTDWTQLPDVPPTTAEKWLPYRQALRDITLQEGFPENVTWPTPP
jgi:hypothetical protein